jgi:hypothetical protein
VIWARSLQAAPTVQSGGVCQLEGFVRAFSYRLWFDLRPVEDEPEMEAVPVRADGPHGGRILVPFTRLYAIMIEVTRSWACSGGDAETWGSASI